MSIWQRGKSYSLRARLPDKSTGKLRQQWISTGCKATKTGLKIAHAKASKLESDLLLERFDWADWGKSGSVRSQNLTGDWVRRFLDWKQETIKESSAQIYRDYLQYLPTDKPISGSLLIDTCRAATSPNSHGRQYCVMIYKQLGQYAGLDIDWAGIAGNHKPRSFDPRDLPSDEDIERLWSERSTQMMRWVYGILATYGLRPHEIYHLDTSRLSEDGVLMVLENTKTGKRPVYPCKAEWVDKFGLISICIPKAKTGLSNKILGGRISKMFRDHKVGHIPYALRHAYAIRLARLGVPPQIAAKWMGHSLAQHYHVYLEAMSEREYQQVWERVVKNS